MKAKNPFQERKVIGRRGGPAKIPLSRDAIVGAALEILKRDGLDGMSLRKVAAALDTGPASLYVYVENLEELGALVLDRALGEVDTSGSRQRDWRSRLRAVLGSYVQVLLRSPGLAALAMSTIAAGPHALRFIERILGLLDEAGVNPPTAAWAVDLLALFATAIAAEQSQRQAGPNPLVPLARVLDSVSAAEHPRIHALREPLLSGTGEERFAWCLEVLLTGILQTPQAAQPKRKKRS